MNAASDFSVGDTFRSNNGAGPWVATITHIRDGFAFMSRRRAGHKEIFGTKLPLWFLNCPACGWSRVGDEMPVESLPWRELLPQQNQECKCVKSGLPVAPCTAKTCFHFTSHGTSCRNCDIYSGDEFRNAKIFEMRRKGESLASIGAAVHLSKQAVHQILKRQSCPDR